MGIEQGFLDDIASNLDDDAPRLIYADWLEEQGRERTGRFIRAQIDRARLDDWHPDAATLDEAIGQLNDARPTALHRPGTNSPLP